MNDLYRNEIRLYKNFFMANVKLAQKKRVGKNKEKIKRIYDRAQTPYQRVLACDQVNKEVKQKLREQYVTLNPAELRRQIKLKLEKLNNINKIIINKIIDLKPETKVTFLDHRTK